MLGLDQMKKRSIFAIGLLSLLLISGCTNTYTECLGNAAKKSGLSNWQMSALSDECKRKYPFVDPPWYQFGKKTVTFTVKKEQCFKVKVSGDFGNLSASKQKRELINWHQRLSAKSRRKYKC